MAVFVERTLTARKGKKRKTLVLRVHAPEDQGDHWKCKYELLLEGKRIAPSAGFGGIGGGDSWQALVLAMKTAAHELTLFESRTGARIDPMEWIDVIDFLAGMPIPDDMRPRLAQIERALDKAQREYREQHAHGHHHDHDAHEHEHEHGAHGHGRAAHAPATRRRKPRTATRKPRAASRKR